MHDSLTENCCHFSKAAVKYILLAWRADHSEEMTSWIRQQTEMSVLIRLFFVFASQFTKDRYCNPCSDHLAGRHFL